MFDELEDNLSQEQIEQYRGNLTIYDYDINEPQIGLSDAALKDILDSSRNIFNCVGDTTFFPRDKEKLFDTNINGPASLVEVLCRNKAVFHHVSTAYVSGSRSGVILESELDVGQRFKNPYEESKCLGEKKVHEVCARQVGFLQCFPAEHCHQKTRHSRQDAASQPLLSVLQRTG